MSKDENNGIGHNSKEDEFWKEALVEYAECDEESRKLNDRRKGIRDAVKARGYETSGFLESYNKAKKSLFAKDSHVKTVERVDEAINDMGMDDLFADVLRRKEEREKEKAQKAEERKAAKEAKELDE